MQTPAESLSQDVVWLDRSSLAATDQTHPAEFTIGELAKEFGVTLRALRFYENKGLIGPRRDGMTRLYNQSDRDRLALILNGKKLGFTLGEIRQMVAAENGRDGKVLQLSQDNCVEQIGLLERQKADIEEGLSELRRIQALLRSKMIEAGPAAAQAKA